MQIFTTQLKAFFSSTTFFSLIHCSIHHRTEMLMLNKKALSWKSVFDWYSNKINVLECRHTHPKYLRNVVGFFLLLTEWERAKKAISTNQCFCINHNMLYPAEDYAIRQGFSPSPPQLPWRWKFEPLEKAYKAKTLLEPKELLNEWFTVKVGEGLLCRYSIAVIRKHSRYSVISCERLMCFWVNRAIDGCWVTSWRFLWTG